MRTDVWLENLKERDNLDDLILEGKLIILCFDVNGIGLVQSRDLVNKVMIQYSASLKDQANCPVSHS
jgi:hypothetical protein